MNLEADADTSAMDAAGETAEAGTAPAAYGLPGAGFGGPDEMGREIAGGPAAAEATLAGVEARGAELHALLEAPARVVLVGTGMSLAVALAAAPAWRRALRAAGRQTPLLVREATAAALRGIDGEEWRAGDAVVAISKSGTSPETLAAARDAAATGAGLMALTAEPASPLAALAWLTVPTPIGEEHGAGTKSGLAALAGLFALAGAIEPAAESRIALRRRLDARVRDWAKAAAAGPALAASERTWIAGLGTGQGLAAAGAIMWHEKAHRPAVALSVSELRHGPVEAVRRGDSVIVVDPDAAEPLRTSYLVRLRSELDALGANVVWLIADDRSGSPAALEALLSLQQLARACALAARTYRDGFAVLRNVVKPVENL